MARRFLITLVFTPLTLLLTGAISFASVIPPIIVFGPGTSGSFSISTSSVTFSGISGSALFEGLVGTFSLANNTLSMTPGNGNMQVFTQPDTTMFKVDIGSDKLAGLLSLDFVQTINNHSFFDGTYSITSSTSGFSSAGFPVGAVTDLNFVTDNSNGSTILSSGEIDPPVPEPGTFALVGSGLLAASGLMRQKANRLHGIP